MPSSSPQLLKRALMASSVCSSGVGPVSQTRLTTSEWLRVSSISTARKRFLALSRLRSGSETSRTFVPQTMKSVSSVGRSFPLCEYLRILRGCLLRLIKMLGGQLMSRIDHCGSVTTLLGSAILQHRILHRNEPEKCSATGKSRSSFRQLVEAKANCSVVTSKRSLCTAFCGWAGTGPTGSDFTAW